MVGKGAVYHPISSDYLPSHRCFDVFPSSVYVTTYTSLRLSMSTTPTVREKEQRHEVAEQWRVEGCTNTASMHKCPHPTAPNAALAGLIVEGEEKR